MLEIETLRFLWWIIIGVLFMGFAVMDGFDLGAAALFPLVARNETEKRIVLNAIGPFWEGNQVWIILGIGALFAAWPFVYAVAFSGAYFLVFLLLLTMGISRPVSFKYRSKLASHIWRHLWDVFVFIGGFCPAIVFGILVGNIFSGLPFYFDTDLRVYYIGNFTDLFHPFAWWCGLTSLCMLCMHGGLYLATKTNDLIRERSIFYACIAAILFIVFFAGGGIWIAEYLVGYQVIGKIDPTAYSNPLHKLVIPKLGAWMQNYVNSPILLILPSVGICGALFAFVTARFRNSYLAFVFSALSIIGVIATVGISLFPFLLPSSTHFNAGLLIWDASSSYLTLWLMLFAVLIFLPIILLYTAWVYRVLRGKVTSDMLESENAVY